MTSPIAELPPLLPSNRLTRKVDDGGRTGGSTVTFADVGGAQEAVAELAEVRDYLEDPRGAAGRGAAAAAAARTCPSRGAERDPAGRPDATARRHPGAAAEQDVGFAAVAPTAVAAAVDVSALRGIDQAPRTELATVDRRRGEQLRALALLSAGGASTFGSARLRTRREHGIRV